jgi:hypothetical protein
VVGKRVGLKVIVGEAVVGATEGYEVDERPLVTHVTPKLLENHRLPPTGAATSNRPVLSDAIACHV